MRKRGILRVLAMLVAFVLFTGILPALAESTDVWMNVMLLGCDSYTTNDRQRTDSMIILSVNLETNQVKMTSLMRDTWIPVPGTKRHRKLTELCAVDGPEMTVRAINESFDMNITKYALISMAGVAEVIELVGGIEIDVTEAERKALNKGLFDLSSLSGMEQLTESGENVHLNGNQATAFARIRNIDSDYVRTHRQRTVLIAVADKLKAGSNAGTLLSIVTTLMNYVDTNLNLTEMMMLASLGLNINLDQIKEFRIPMDGTFESGMYQGYWSIRPDFARNAEALHNFIYGEK